MKLSYTIDPETHKWIDVEEVENWELHKCSNEDFPFNDFDNSKKIILERSKQSLLI